MKIRNSCQNKLEAVTSTGELPRGVAGRLRVLHSLLLVTQVTMKSFVSP